MRTVVRCSAGERDRGGTVNILDKVCRVWSCRQEKRKTTDVVKEDIGATGCRDKVRWVSESL